MLAMKKKKYTPILFAASALGLTALFLSVPVVPAMSGIRTTAQTGNNLLDRVADLYKNFKTIQADFDFRYFRNDQDQTGQSESGSLLLDQRTGKYRITTAGQLLISDGKSQWAVLHDADEVQITAVDHTSGSITPFNVFSFFTEGYTHKQLTGERERGIPLDVIELIPDDRRKNFSKIILRINRTNNQVHDVTIFDKNKSRYSYQIKNLETNPVIADSKFMFDKNEFPGMEIVDLR